MGLPRIVADGNLTADPEIRFTQSGKSVVNFTIACSDRVPDGSGGFKDSEPTFLRCQYWGKPAERLVESVRKGDHLLVSGRFQQRTYENHEGEKRTANEVVCDSVGVSTVFTVAKTDRAYADSGPVVSSPQQADEVPF